MLIAERLPILSSMAWIPLEYVKNLKSLKRKLTVSVPLEYKSKETVKVHAYSLSRKGYIGVPRVFGLEEFSHLQFIDRTVSGDIKGWPRKHIKPRDVDQKRFMESLADVCNHRANTCDFLANARTGSGKTVTDLWLTKMLKRTTLIVVPTNRLKNQWLGSIEKRRGMEYFYGADFVALSTGVVQQNKCNYENKNVVVGMLPSLARRNYGQAFYRYFGKVTFDEFHKCSAPLMSETLKLFPAKIRGGYTATDRTDALFKLGKWHLGEHRIESIQEVLKPKVYILTFKEHGNLQSYSDFQLISSVSRITRRNELLLKLILNRGVERKRNVIVLSDRTDQLVQLYQRLLDKGLTYKQVGLYVGSYKLNGKDTKPTTAHFEWIEKNCSIILATYGIFATGIDVPRLDLGIEATPRGNVTQAVGRILREYPNKPIPEWISINDVITSIKGKVYQNFIDMSYARLNSFNKHKAEIKYLG